jgi:hypothetical protein
MYLTDYGEIIFDYSHLIVRDKEQYPGAPNYFMDPGEYLLDFAMPSVVEGRLVRPCRQVQNYCLTAMLFYLLIGKLPYDGPLMMGFPDTNPIEHMHKFEVYHKNPVFIFDLADTSNQLGAFAADEKFIDAWEELPIQIQEVFRETLRKENASFGNPDRISAPDPNKWLTLLDKL